MCTHKLFLLALKLLKTPFKYNTKPSSAQNRFPKAIIYHWFKMYIYIHDNNTVIFYVIYWTWFHHTHSVGR